MKRTPRIQPQAVPPEPQRSTQPPKISPHALTPEDAAHQTAEPDDATDWSLRDRGTLTPSGAPTRHAPPWDAPKRLPKK